MIFLLLFSFFFLAMALSLRSSQPSETRFVLSACIDRPPHSVFETIKSVMRVPVWGRHPHWLPRPLRISTMAGWEETLAAGRRFSGSDHRPLEEVHVRSIQNKELSYCSIRRRNLICESNFRLSAQNGKCLLIWEIRYQLFRLPDIVSRNTIADSVQRSMANSLSTIHRLALIRSASPYPREELFKARRNHVPAA